MPFPLEEYIKEIFNMEWAKRFFSAETPRVEKPEKFIDFPRVIEERCVQCSECERVCPVKAIEVSEEKPRLDKNRCIRCGRCAEICPTSTLITGEKGE